MTWTCTTRSNATDRVNRLATPPYGWPDSGQSMPSTRIVRSVPVPSVTWIVSPSTTLVTVAAKVRARVWADADDPEAIAALSGEHAHSVSVTIARARRADEFARPDLRGRGGAHLFNMNS